MEAMARRIQIQLIALFCCLVTAASAQSGVSNVLVSYSFDDAQLATGPDTFAVFAKSRGTVRLNGANRLSGYRSVEIRDVAGDGDFPELQGYFVPRSKGKLFLHFAFMTATPYEEFNIALAGPQWFNLRKDGIGFWLKTREGHLCQVSDSMPKKLFLLEPFVWYAVNTVYDIDQGSYDLVIHKEGLDKPIVFLERQANGPNQRGSAVDKFSFIGDTGEDKSNVTYYVDDVLVGVDESIVHLPFVAPGRKKLFIDYWSEAQRKQHSQPGPIEAIDLADFGIRQKEIEAFKAAGQWELLLRAIDRQSTVSEVPQETLGENQRLLRAVVLWSEGVRALNAQKATDALKRFDEAAALMPSAKIYAMNAVLSLVALQEWGAVDERLSRIYGDWQDDVRFVPSMAAIGLARQRLDEAEQWLQNPAEQIPDQLGQDLLHRLRSGAMTPDLLQQLKARFPDNWDDYIKDVLVAEQYFLVLLWKNQAAAAERFAQRMADRYEALGIPSSRWYERMGDAAFFLGNLTMALQQYEKGLKGHEQNPAILVKLSDVYFRLGDLENERVYREKIYGTIGSE
jgi:tetratricopeptide (TPR) repeat protein